MWRHISMPQTSKLPSNHCTIRYAMNVKDLIEMLLDRIISEQILPPHPSSTKSSTANGIPCEQPKDLQLERCIGAKKGFKNWRKEAHWKFKILGMKESRGRDCNKHGVCGMLFIFQKGKKSWIHLAVLVARRHSYTGVGQSTLPRFCEYEVKKLRPPACSRLQNAIFSSSYSRNPERTIKFTPVCLCIWDRMCKFWHEILR